MFDVWMLLAALLHFAVLAGAIVGMCRRWALPWRDWPLAAYVLLWAGLVFGAHGASVAHALNDLTVYVPCTLAAVAGLLALFRFVDGQSPAAPLLTMPQLAFTPIENPKVRRFLFWFLIGSLAFVGLSSLVLGLSVYPDNADSMIYRLPRAFWYVSNGSFLHPFESLDKRITFYPLDGVALYVPLVLYNLPGTLHSAPSLVAWFLLVYTSYRFARALGADRLIALFSAWLVAVTPSILAQATSTNDEIFTAVVLLVGLYMGWRWLVTGRHGYFLLMAMAVGLSVGTKLHIIFLTPVLLAAFALAAWHARQEKGTWRRWLSAIGGRTFSISLAVAIFLVVPFLFYNYASTGRFYFFNDFKAEVFNLQGSLQGIFQNLLIYLSQMLFSPIADLNSWPVANDRQAFNSMLNAAIDPWIRPYIDWNPSHYHMNYRYVGVTLPVSVRFVEFSLWSGFVWMLWPLQARLALKQAFPLRGLFFLIALTPPIWLLFWSATTLYMEGTATYFTFYLICAAPAAAFSFGDIRRPTLSELRWVLIALVAATNLIISVNMLMFSGFRALPDLYYARTWPFDWDLVDPKIIAELRRADRARIVLLHEKMPYFAFMHWNPMARYYTPYPVDRLPDADGILQILPVSSMDRYGYVVLNIPGKTAKGVTYLGTMRGIGREAIFALGNGVERRYPDDSHYAILSMSVLPAVGGSVVRMETRAMGLFAEDNLEFHYVMTYDGKELFRRDWSRDPGFTVNVLGYNPEAQQALLTVMVRSALSHKALTQATVHVGGQGAWLPDGSEY